MHLTPSARDAAIALLNNRDEKNAVGFGNGLATASSNSAT